MQSKRQHGLRHQGDEEVGTDPEEHGRASHRRTKRDGLEQVALLRQPLLLPPVDGQHLSRHGIPHRRGSEIALGCLRILRRVDGKVLRRGNRARSFISSPTQHHSQR